MHCSGRGFSPPLFHSIGGNIAGFDEAWLTTPRQSRFILYHPGSIGNFYKPIKEVAISASDGIIISRFQAGYRKEYPMKAIIIACLLLFALPLAFGATKCKIVEYQDRSEITCIGDEKAAPEPVVAATPSQPINGEPLAENQVRRPQIAETAPSTVKPQQSPEPSASAAQQSNTQVKPADKASENLAKRRALATRNTRNLMGYTSATAPPVK